MNSLRNFIAGVLGALVRLTLWLFTALLALLLLAVALVLLFFGVLWALVRGKRPVQPVFVGRFRQYASQKVWPGGGAGGPRGASAETAEVVDIEVREVRDPGDAGERGDRNPPQGAHPHQGRLDGPGQR